jgi:hypothetical protein
MNHYRPRWASAVLAIVAVLALGQGITYGATLVLAPSQQAAISNPADAAELRLLLQIDVPRALSEGTVELAILELPYRVACPESTGVVTVEAYLVTTSWSEGSVEWENTWSTPGGDVDGTRHAVWEATCGDSARLRFDITDMVSAWAMGEVQDHGLLVKLAPGETGSIDLSGGPDRSSWEPRALVWYTPRRED